MDKNINLDIDTILNKDFSIDFKGYSPIEVDQFLDLIVKDYDTFINEVNDLTERIALYEESNNALKAKVLELENKLKISEESKANMTGGNPVVSNLSQVDILRRIARLEQEVFNK